MPMTIQLSELIPVETPAGRGYAIILDSGEHDNYWTVALENGALITYRQEKIRICRSYTHGRGIDDEGMRRIITRKQGEAP